MLSNNPIDIYVKLWFGIIVYSFIAQGVIVAMIIW